MFPAQTLIERYAERHPDISPRIFRCSFLIGDRPAHSPGHRVEHH